MNLILTDYTRLYKLLNHKTERQVMCKLIEALFIIEARCNLTQTITFKIIDLSKALKYKNKSTVSRALKNLADWGYITLTTNRNGCSVSFKDDTIKMGLL